MKKRSRHQRDHSQTRLDIQNGDEDAETVLDRIVEDFTRRIREGESPSIRQYQKSYPIHHDEIFELLSSVAMIEGLKPSAATLAEAQHGSMNQIAKLERLGDYQIIRELGRGGMGVVMEAIHESLGRRVAIKILPPRWIDNEKYAERFRREAQAAATLHHTNIVSVFGSFESDGYHYFVMEYVDGQGLDKIIHSARTESLSGKDALTARRPRSSPQVPSRPTLAQMPSGKARFPWIASVGAQIADALQHAHEHEKLHRDIKPSNLLLEPDGRVWLTDFGLVKNTDHPAVTETGDIVGTPRYMAPEAFSGTYDARSETYCLGLTLYEMATLQPAFEEASAPELLKTITTSFPKPARQIVPHLPRDLDTIITKAVERDPARRYASAASLRDDLNAFLGQRPIQARRASPPERAWLWCRRNPWVALAAMLLLVVAITTSTAYVVTSQALHDTSQAQQVAENNAAQLAVQFERADDNATQFKIQFERAEENFLRAESNVDLALEMFDEMFKQMALRGMNQPDGFEFDGFEELSGIETTISDADAKYLEAMMVFFQQFGEQNAGNQTLQIESAQAFRRVANIYHLDGQYQEAIIAYRQSLKLQEAIQEENPLAIDTLLTQVHTRNEMGLVILQTGKLRVAEKTFQETIQRLDAKRHLANDLLSYELVRTLNLRGSAAPIESPDILLGILGSPNNANAKPDRRNNTRQRWRKRTTRRNRQVAKSNTDFIARAISIVDNLIEKDPSQPDYQLERAKSYVRLADLQFWAEQTQDSESSTQIAIQELLQLVDHYPDQEQYRAVLAQVYALPYGEHPAQQLIQLKKAQAISLDLSEQAPRNVEFQQLDANIHYQLAQLRRDSGNTVAAIKDYRYALDKLNLITQTNQRNQWLQARRIVLTIELANLLLDLERFEEARDLMMPISRKISGALKRRNGDRAAIRLLLIRFFETLITVQETLENHAGARRAKQQLKQIRDTNPGGRTNPKEPQKKKRGRDDKRPSELS